MNFTVPPEVREHVPNDCNLDLKTYLNMEYAANAVSKEGDPFEFKLKIHPHNDKLPFLDSSHELHGCYQFLRKNPQHHLFRKNKNKVPSLLHELYEQVFLDGKEVVSVKEKAQNIIIEGYSDSE